MDFNPSRNRNNYRIKLTTTINEPLVIPNLAGGTYEIESIYPRREPVSTACGLSAIGLPSGIGVSVTTGTSVGVAVATGISVGVSVATDVSVGTSVTVASIVGTSVAVSTAVGASVAVASGIAEGVTVAVGTLVGTDVAVALGTTVAVGSSALTAPVTWNVVDALRLTPITLP
jgi:hypothetical protein